MKLITLVALLATASLLRAAPVTLTLDVAHPAGHASPSFYGLMTEEINHSYDGGLYAELIRNRAFLDQADTPADWSVVQQGDAAASIAVDHAQPLNREIPVSLRLEVTKASDAAQAGFANPGYWGIPVRPNTTYRASFFAKADGHFAGKVTLAIQSDDGRTTYATATVDGLGEGWKQYQAELKTGDVAPTAKARFAVTVNEPGTVWFGFVSLFPPTWNNRPNGMRQDLMQMLVDLKPKFLRFPGGNYVEGDTIATRFDWKKTIGPVSERPGHEGPWGYRSTDGMGLLEFLEWCDDMGGQPVLAVYAGYSLRGECVKAGPDLQPYVQDALDEIEYVTGSVDTKWGAQRARDGHPAPFPLRYVEIGNEDNFDKTNSYDGRFTQFYDAIKAKYPELQCISTVALHDPAVKRVSHRRPDVVDEHYYAPVDKFLTMATGQYDGYDRRGPKIFVGEWASYETPFPPWNERSKNEPPTPNLRAAIGDAAFMTDLERNADLVIMNCYAPLLVNVNPGARQWRPDLIGYDALQAFGSPSYYAFKMFSTHFGDEILRVTPLKSDVIACATRSSETGEVYLKLVNPQATPVAVTITINGAPNLGETATVETLAAPTATATNSLAAPTAVVPATATLSDVRSGFTYTVPANGVAVLTLKTK